MRDIAPIFLPTSLEKHLVDKGVPTTSNNFLRIAKSPGYPIQTFSELRKEIAKVAVKNPNVILFFRGQNEDYQREGATTIMPSIFR